MSRNSLIALALLAASCGAMAHGDLVYGRVVAVEPQFSISISGGRHHDGFRVLYESGGQRYWTYSVYHPGPVIWVPYPPGHHVHPPRHRHHHRHEWGGWRDGPGRDGHRGWDERERRRDW